MQKKYQVWKDDNEYSTTVAEETTILRMQKQGLIPSDARHLCDIHVDTYEEAQAVFHIKMGYEPYKPEGGAVSCPNQCGFSYYPKDSGECPKCGKII